MDAAELLKLAMTPKKGVQATQKTPATTQDYPGAGGGGPKPGYLTSQGIDPGATGRLLQEAVQRQKLSTGAPVGKPQMDIADPNFDPVTGIDWNSTRIWKTLEGDKEKTAFLQDGVKKGLWQGYGQTEDTKQWFVTKDGKNIAIDSINVPKEVSAGIAAHPGEAAGMAATAVLFPEAAPEELSEGALLKNAAKQMWERFLSGSKYIAGRAALTGTAAMAGKGLDEAIKAGTTAYYRQTPKELVQNIGEAGAGGFLTEAGLRGGGAVVRGLRQGYSKFIEPEIQDLVRRVLAEGGRPSIRQATAGAAKLFPWEQAFAEMAFGNPAAKRNFQMMTGQMVDSLEKAGWSRDEAQRIVAGMRKEPGQVGDPLPTTEKLQAGVQSRVERSAAAVDVEGEGLKQDLNKQLSRIEKDMASPDPALQQKVRQDIIDQRVKFGKQAKDAYNQVDALVGNQKLVPTKEIKAAAQAILDRARFKFGVHDIPKDIQAVTNLPDQISFAEAQDLRETFKKAGLGDLTKGVEEHDYTELGNSVDKAFANASQGAGPQAAKALKDADAFYKNGIKQFQQLSVRQLAKDAARTAYADPEKVVSQIFKTDLSAQAAQIKKLVSPQNWKNIGATYWKDLSRDAEITGADGNTVVSGKKLAALLKKAGNNLDVAFGSEKAAQMRAYADRLARMDGKYDPMNVNPDNFMQRINTFLKGKEQHDEMMRTNFVQMLTSNKGVDRSDAVSWIMEDPKRVIEAKNFYHEDSPEWDAIRKEAMVNLLRHTVKPGEDILAKALVPGGLSGIVKNTNPRVLTEIFGEDVAASLHELARKIDFLSAPPRKLGTASFAISAMMLHPVMHVAGLANLFAGANLMRSEPFLRWLVLGLDGDTRAMRIAGSIARTAGYTLEPGSGVGAGPSKAIQSIPGMIGQDIKSGAESDPILQMLQSPGGGPQGTRPVP